jgi:hypothetical protein
LKLLKLLMLRHFRTMVAAHLEEEEFNRWCKLLRSKNIY